MTSCREIVRTAFDEWMDGSGCSSSIFASDMALEIVGHSAAAGRSTSAQEFQGEVLGPFAQRLDPEVALRLEGTAFLDSISFNELWAIEPEAG